MHYLKNYVFLARLLYAKDVKLATCKIKTEVRGELWIASEKSLQSVQDILADII